MTDFVHTCRGKVVDNGSGGRKFIPHDPQEMRWLFLRHDPETEVVMGVKRWRSKHSPEQRGYLHGVVLPAIGECIGEDDLKSLYAWAKQEFNYKIIVGKDDQEARIGQSLKESDTAEMTIFIDKLIRWAGTFLGLTIPPPDRTMTGGGGI